MKATRYNISIGLNDSYSKKEEVNTDELIGLLEYYFKKYKIDFSLCKINGGYFYDDIGTLVNENSIVITCITQSDDYLERFIAAIKMIMNQETILLEAKDIEVEYI